MADRHVVVIGGGWSGLAAAVEATRLGHHVTLFEMAPQLGGRARQVDFGGTLLDNGQHILIGAYHETLALMRLVGVDVGRVLLRMPLRVTYADGSGLQMPPGSPVPAFARAVLRYAGWTWRDKLALLTAASRWALQRFRCDPCLTVSQLTHSLPSKVREELLDPLCIAALNTPAEQASAMVFLRVLKDALFGGPGSADLLLPRLPLSQLWPSPAARWLTSNGASIRLMERVTSLEPSSTGWRVNSQVADAVILACTATEAARLTAAFSPEWSAQAHELHYEPIVTVYARSTGCSLPQPMMALRGDAEYPAQFVFDLGAIGGQSGVLAFVISGAAHWVNQGLEAATEATLAQATQELKSYLSNPIEALHTSAEKRATFLCKPLMKRPSTRVLPSLWAAGDYVEGPYPATLEGAIQSGLVAARAIA